MMISTQFHHRVSLLIVITAAAATQLPYNPTRVITNRNGTFAYILAPDASSPQCSLSILNTTTTLSSSVDSLKTLNSRLPFLSSSKAKAFTPIATDDGGITILVGDCTDGAQGLELWRFTPSNDYTTGTWSNLQLTLYDATLAANFLAAGFAFSPSASTHNEGLYIFGGMCPLSPEPTPSDWTEDATYSNTMLTLSPGLNSANASKTPYDLSMTGQRAPPVAEAGLSITPLSPTFSTNSDGSVSQQQDFVLVGGHTSNAFINMSQIALFSLPEQAWGFVEVSQPTTANTDLMGRNTASIQPRSGHTAVLTPDGSRIIIFGGWVGDIATPAAPQLAILEVGQGYGGTSGWMWKTPSEVSSPFTSSKGVYGHAAAMLPGGVMMVSGGYKISSGASTVKRDVSNQLLFFNTTSSLWIDTYSNPDTPSSVNYVAPSHASSSNISSAQKVGLGAGLGIGVVVIVALWLFWFLYRRRLQNKRVAREKELRELALGADRNEFGYVGGVGVDGHDGYGGSLERYPSMRSSSWGNRQEQMMESHGEHYWAPAMSGEDTVGAGPARDDADGNGLRHAERTGLLMDVPSPTRGLRRSLHSRGATGYGANVGAAGAPSVFRIDEEEEGSHAGSLRVAQRPSREAVNTPSDPFNDPPDLSSTGSRPHTAAEERKKEVQGWVEDWKAAEENIMTRNTSRATSHGRTYSNLSEFQNNSHSGSSQSGRGSPEKSDRTGSDLSERSMYSIQRSNAGTISRNLSQRSASAGYALFTGAAAAMAKVRGESSRPAEYGTVNTGRGSLARAPSKRSTSLNMNSTSSSHGHERTETFSSARTSFGPAMPGEDHLLLRPNSRAVVDEKEYWATPPESPVKRTRGDSFGSQAGRKALGIIGSMRRVFTGTNNVDVGSRVANLEQRGGQSSPTKDHPPEMSEAPRRTVSAGAAFWRGKQGARDWDEDAGLGPSDTTRRKRVPGHSDDDVVDEEWDVERAIQQRVVQVMFTVPKEKLRVVNADALSLMSKSDADLEDDKDRDKEIKRMSSVREGDEGSAEDRVMVQAEDIEVKRVTFEPEQHQDRETGDEAGVQRQRSGKGKAKAKPKYIFDD